MSFFLNLHAVELLTAHVCISHVLVVTSTVAEEMTSCSTVHRVYLPSFDSSLSSNRFYSVRASNQMSVNVGLVSA
jgi:hypothetical protein